MHLALNFFDVFEAQFWFSRFLAILEISIQNYVLYAISVPSTYWNKVKRKLLVMNRTRKNNFFEIEK